MNFKILFVLIVLIGMFTLSNADDVKAYVVPQSLINSEDGAFKPNAVIGCLDYVGTDILIYLWETPNRTKIIASVQNFTQMKILSIIEDYRARKFTGSVCVLVRDIFGNEGWISIIQVYSIFNKEGDKDGKASIKLIWTGSV